MTDATGIGIGDVVKLGAETGHGGVEGVIASLIDVIIDGQFTYRYSVRLPDDSLIEAGPDDLRPTGECVLLFQPDEVVRIRQSAKFPELIGAEGIVCGFGEIAPREFEYAVYITHLERVYAFLGGDLESLGRFESLM